MRIPPCLTRRSGDTARGTAGTNLIQVAEWDKVGSDALKPDRMVGFRGIVAKWGAECFCASGVIVNICLLFFWSSIYPQFKNT